MRIRVGVDTVRRSQQRLDVFCLSSRRTESPTDTSKSLPSHYYYPQPGLRRASPSKKSPSHKGHIGCVSSRTTSEYLQKINQTFLTMTSDSAVAELLQGEKQASHLCHFPTCINPNHLTVETKEQNEARKSCAGKVSLKFQSTL